MTRKDADALVGRVFARDRLTYTVISASTYGEVCVWNPSTQTLLRFDSRATFDHWAHGTPVPAADALATQERRE